MDELDEAFDTEIGERSDPIELLRKIEH